MFSGKNKMFSTKNYSKLNSPKRLDEKTQLFNDLEKILIAKKLQNKKKTYISPPPSPPGEKSLSFPLTLPPPMQQTEGRIPYTHFVSKRDGTLVSESALGLTKRKRRKTKRRKTKRRKTKGKKTKRR